MTDLAIPLVLSLLAVWAGTLCRFRGSRVLLIGMGALTAIAIVLVMVLTPLAAGLGCQGSTLRSMSCPAGSALAGLVRSIGAMAALLMLPGLVAGPFAVPLAGLAEFWTRRNAGD